MQFSININFMICASLPQRGRWFLLSSRTCLFTCIAWVVAFFWWCPLDGDEWWCLSSFSWLRSKERGGIVMDIGGIIDNWLFKSMVFWPFSLFWVLALWSLSHRCLWLMLFRLRTSVLILFLLTVIISCLISREVLSIFFMHSVTDWSRRHHSYVH